MNNSLTKRKGTLRGLHFQLPPAAEVKIIRCTRGALFDLIIDLRLDSPTFGKWFGVELSGSNRRMMYVPRGFAHSFLTLTDDTEVLYLVSDSHSPQLERGIRWNDPYFKISWPIPVIEVSPKDQNWPDFGGYFDGLEMLRGLK